MHKSRPDLLFALCFLILYMENFYKYIQARQDYSFMDLVVVNAGHTHIEANASYPPVHHPDHHHFDFTLGRVIEEYQLVYITSGRGVLETRSGGRYIIESGEGFVLFPGEWHRFRPDKKSGWTENWVGFKSSVSPFEPVPRLMSKVHPVFRIGMDDQVVSMMNQLFDTVRSDLVGTEYVLSGRVIHLIAHLLTLLKRQELKISGRTDEIIMTAKSIMESHYSEKVSLEDIADQLHISYAWFRKYFRKNTGFSPYDYLINIRINHAKIMLKNSGRSVKEISQASGFESQQQFSRTFKKKAGITPVQFRNT